MSFSLRLWAMTLLALAIFTVWSFVHDNLVPGLSPEASHAIVAAAAWIFGLGGAVVIDRFHRHAGRLAEKAARDETVIQLAGAVAHELNQPLTIVVSTAELLSRRDSIPEDLRPYLRQLIDASERMADIVRKLERATSYRSKPYVGGVRIVDMDGSSEQ